MIKKLYVIKTASTIQYNTTQSQVYDEQVQSAYGPQEDAFALESTP